MKKTGRYKFYFKETSRLTVDEKNQMMRLMSDTYPDFKKYYLKNKYYSTVRPQMVNLVKQGNEIVGTGKFLWKKLKINKKQLKLFAFGVLIKKEHQKMGLGTEVIKRNIIEARKRKADILYGSTSNPIVGKILLKLEFRRLRLPVFYKEPLSRKIKGEVNNVYVFEFKKGVVKKIESLEKLYIGIGPI